MLAGSWVLQALVSLGIGYVTYTGVDVTLDWLKTEAISSLQGMPTGVVQLLAFLKVGQCVSIVFSAISIRMGINGMQSGTFKRWVTK